MLKLFISYNHNNEECISHFLRHISTLTTGENPEIEVWYDRNLKSGDQFWDNIDEHLVNSDIICVFISASYLASPSCRKEMDKAMELYNANEAKVVPIPISACAWLECPISRVLAATKDGKYICDYDNSESAWYEVYQNIKKTLNEIYASRQNVHETMHERTELHFSNDFCTFLNNTEILSKTHSTKRELLLDDILIHPELTSLKNKLPEVHCNCMQVIKGFSQGDRIAIVGEEQSGKTTLAKLFVKELYDKGLVPVFVRDDSPILQGNLEIKIEKAFIEQYESQGSIKDVDSSRIVPIIDDFYRAKRVEDYLEILDSYGSSIIIVDDIFNLDYNLEKATSSYTKYKIRELKPSLRVALIKKWLLVSENHQPNRYIANDFYAQLDEAKSRIDTQIDHGIMPSYPFFILFLLSTYETMEKPMDKEITTQGYCYQSLIYFFLRKQGVKSGDIEAYLNFLTELAYAIFKRNGALSDDEYQEFIQVYKSRFNLTISTSELLRKLLACNILEVTTSRYYHFAYPYLYYFFAGKFFADNYDEEDEDNKGIMEDIDLIFHNLHKNDYSYITVFIAHHTKSKKIIKRIELIANSMFANQPVATFSAEELSFFNVNTLITPSLPSENNNPEEQRSLQLRREDEEEEKLRTEKQSEDAASDLSMQLRSSIKTVEVIGQILRNRAGSMLKPDLKRLCSEAMDVHLRLLSSFFNLVKVIAKDKENLHFLADRICLTKPSISHEEALNLAEPLFWNMNLGVIIGFVSKITNSLSSSNLLPIIKDVCDEKQTMASAIIKQNAVMWVRKSLHFDELKQIIDQSENPIAKKAMSCLLVDYCMIHNIDEKDRSKLLNLGFKKQYLLPRK